MAESAAEVELHEDSAYQLLSGTQKCAIVMLLLGEDEAADEQSRRALVECDLGGGRTSLEEAGDESPVDEDRERCDDDRRHQHDPWSAAQAIDERRSRPLDAAEEDDEADDDDDEGIAPESVGPSATDADADTALGCRTSPTSSWLTERSLCHAALPGSNAARRSAISMDAR